MTVKTTRVNEDKPLLTGPATLYNQNAWVYLNYTIINLLNINWFSFVYSVIKTAN